MSQQAVLDFSVGPLLHTLRSEATTVRTLAEARPAPAQETTFHLSTVDTDTEMEACKGSLRELLELQADVKAYASGLAELSTSYRPSLDETDFAAELDALAARARHSTRYVATQDPVYTALLAELADRAGEGAPAADADEDLILDDTQRAVAKNAKCPITGRAVLDLADPVEDEVGYVYEKAAIVKYIRDAERRRPGQPVDCPIAATNHKLSANALRRATRVVREQKRLRRRGGTQLAEDDDEDVIDV